LDGRCRATKANGERCRGAATASNGYCWAHDPKNAEKRQRTASRAGKSKASKLTKDLHELLEDLTSRVVDGELETSRGAVANQLIGTRIRLLEYERKLKETEELERRLQELESLLETREGQSRWG
jgi:hypothetical protein